MSLGEAEFVSQPCSRAFAGQNGLELEAPTVGDDVVDPHRLGVQVEHAEDGRRGVAGRLGLGADDWSVESGRLDSADEHMMRRW